MENRPKRHNTGCRAKAIRHMIKYLISSEIDQQWGITVTTVGAIDIEPHVVYPPLIGHPDKYYFTPQKGRILDEYQLIYISRGEGTYYHPSGECTKLSGGDMFIVRPSVWHSYAPSQHTGWSEHWIGFKGSIIDERFRGIFFPVDKSIYKIGHAPTITDFFNDAINVALGEQSNYQQYLAGIVNHLLGLTLYYDSNQQFVPRRVDQMDQARMIIKEHIFDNITPQQVAGQLNMSYSWFRRMFKEYTNMTPANYIQELKIEIAKDLVISTDLAVKEICFKLNYEDPSYFILLFKKNTGLTPLEYRNKIRGKTA